VRIAAWNLGHQTYEKEVPTQFFDAVALLHPEVLVLNEYVYGEKHAEKMRAGLERIGFPAVSVSPRIPGQNQVLLASRAPHLSGDLVGPATTPAATVNFLHVAMSDLEVVGMRAPAYSNSSQLEDYWTETESLIMRTVTRRIVFIGDMNCDPDRPLKPGGRALKRLRDAGWLIPTPIGEWSFIGKDGTKFSRIDHCICSPALVRPIATYVYRINGLILAGQTSDKAISDHAALILDVGV
jgi:hypothetical protein